MKKECVITVVYPVTFDLYGFAKNEKKKDIIKLLDKDVLCDEEIETLRVYALDSADYVYESSGVKPIIQDCDKDELID